MEHPIVIATVLAYDAGVYESAKDIETLKARVVELEGGLRRIKHLASHAPGAGQASTLQLIENAADKALTVDSQGGQE